MQVSIRPTEECQPSRILFITICTGGDASIPRCAITVYALFFVGFLSFVGIGVGLAVGQSNSQKDVVLLHAPAKMIAALPVGLLPCSRKMMDSESISPNVRSAYATMGFLVLDAGDR